MCIHVHVIVLVSRFHVTGLKSKSLLFSSLHSQEKERKRKEEEGMYILSCNTQCVLLVTKHYILILVIQVTMETSRESELYWRVWT